MNTARHTTRYPAFVPPEGFPILLRPDILNLGASPIGHRLQVWMGPVDQIEGNSMMGGPEGERAAYVDIINQLVNLAYYHYRRYLEEITYAKEEVKGTSFDDSAE